ncbi:MAG: electron transfer flavoprotein subunit alpha/FixB family protein [Deltaproteobacteria bacterium]|nr:electron transfer flavoprotein subunit alpha/FixB family protein [Deltaproteobacteria bacterium]
MSKTLIYIEHAHGKMQKASAVAVAAAKAAGGDLTAVVLGKGVDTVAAEAATLGVAKVVLVDDPRLEHYLADIAAQAVAQVAKAEGATTIIAAATAIGKDFFPRVAQLLEAGMASDVTSIGTDGTIERPTYAGNVVSRVQIATPIRVITVRGTAYPPVAPGGAAAPVEKVALAADAKSKMRFVEFAETKSDRPQLTDAKIVVSGGRGLKSGENFTVVLEPLVDALGAAMGASRAAVDAGFVPNDLQVGQTGKVVAPQLYIAVGISGAIQHLAGMKDSKVIVAINKDGDAPIFNISDYGLVADLFKAVPEMTEEVKKLKAS